MFVFLKFKQSIMVTFLTISDNNRPGAENLLLIEEFVRTSFTGQYCLEANTLWNKNCKGFI